MKESKEERDYVKAGLATLLLFIFLAVCVVLDHQGVRSHYLLWLCFNLDSLSIYWPNDLDPHLFKISLPFSTFLDTGVPLMPLTLVIVYLQKLGGYLKLNPTHFRNHRIHHYHVGILNILVGILLISLKTGITPFLLNGKETNPMEITQSLGICLLMGGIAFILLDSKDLRNRKPNNA